MQSRNRWVPWILVAVMWWLTPQSAVKADYAVLRGVPVTQGQMRVADADWKRLQTEIPANQNGSPCDALILKETRVQGEVSGVVARVRVTQVFQNPYSERLEALYVFPLPENAAVDRYSFEIGERVIRGVVQERAAARRAYEEARAQGRQAALLEQERANIFSQAVTNIPPQETITVHIEYVHPLEIDGDRYVFRFPMVVGPRYIPGQPLGTPNVGRGWASDTDQVPDASRITPPMLPPGTRNGNDVSIELQIDAGMPIQEVVGVTHELTVNQVSETESRVNLKNQVAIPDKDFVVEYRLAGGETVLASLTHRKEGDGYLVLVLQPKWQIEQQELAPREVVLLLDTSGSMNGPPISQLRVFAEHVLSGLNQQDTFRLVAFSNQPRPLTSDPVPATAENVARAKDYVRHLNASGGTELLAALHTGLEVQRGEEGRPRYLVLLTDALVGDDDTILRYLADPEHADVRCFPVAFGAAPNHHLIQRAADIARGFALQVTNQDNPAAIAQRFQEKVSAPYMTDVEIDWAGLPVKDVIPERLPDLYAGRPLVIMGRYTGQAAAEVTLRGNVSGQQVQMALNLSLPQEEPAHDAIGPLWARQRIQQITNRHLGHETPESRAQITQLGLTHQLVTAYTSFVAVAEEPMADLTTKLRQETVRVMTPEGMTEGREGVAPPRVAPAAGTVAQSAPSPAHTYAAPQVPYVAPNLPASSYDGAAGGGGSRSGGGGGGAVEWLFLIGVGALASGQLYDRRRRRGENDA